MTSKTELTSPMPSTAPPKRRKGASKKLKKSWRKNTDLDDVDEFLEDQVKIYNLYNSNLKKSKLVLRRRLWRVWQNVAQKFVQFRPDLTYFRLKFELST